MENETLIAIAIAAVVVIGLLVIAWSRRQEAVKDQHREEAAEHRRLAAVTSLDADKRAAAAEERAARAKREELEAEEERIEAMRTQDEASALHRKADELDPDVDLNARDEDEGDVEVDDIPEDRLGDDRRTG